MTERERFLALIRGRNVGRPGFWLGNPHEDALPKLLEYYQVENRMALALLLKDSFCIRSPDWFLRGGESKPQFDAMSGPSYVFAECEDVAEVEAYSAWPEPDDLDLEALEAALVNAAHTGMAVTGGSWSPFFHIIADLFGMENYFVKMYTDPDVVMAVTERVVDYYYEINERVYRKMANYIDAYFLGNDFGSQLDLLVSPDCFRKFVLPSFKKLIDQAKRYNLPVILHSCGAISRVIPDLIDAGVDALHPLQARANRMDAEHLAQYKNDILFIGGVDTQQLLPFGKPDEVANEVRRIHKLWGNRWIVSPSHETLLPNVPMENVRAMHEAAMTL